MEIGLLFTRCAFVFILTKGSELAQYKITVDSEDVHQLLLGSSQDSELAMLLDSILDQVLKAQVTEQVGTNSSSALKIEA